MTIQYSFFDDKTIDERFRAFHAEHPEVLEELEALTQLALNSGRRRLGIRMLWERMRWTFYIERKDDDFKMNDHFHSRYVRLMIARHPSWADVFEVRALRAV